PAREPRTVLRTLECSECRAPGPAEALPGGKCRTCQGALTPRTPGLPAQRVRAKADEVRAALLAPSDRPKR
ncbi:hypothetical protein ABZ564_32475, partial [Streptomyces sp. NPDC019224]